MNIARLDPITAAAKFRPADELTEVAVEQVKPDAPHSSTLRNCVLNGVPAFTRRDADGSQSCHSSEPVPDIGSPLFDSVPPDGRMLVKHPFCVVERVGQLAVLPLIVGVPVMVRLNPLAAAWPVAARS